MLDLGPLRTGPTDTPTKPLISNQPQRGPYYSCTTTLQSFLRIFGGGVRFSEWLSNATHSCGSEVGTWEKNAVW